jgi:hypothetical protein
MSVSIINRRNWNARSPSSSIFTVSWREKTEFIVHHSAGPTSQTVRQIQDYHINGKGWSDIGYNFLVDNDGHVYEGRGWLAVGAQAKNHNRSGIGVCFIGDSNKVTVSLKAKEAIKDLYGEAVRRKGSPLRITGHGLLKDQATSCPGNRLRNWILAGMLSPEPEEDKMELSTRVKVDPFWLDKKQLDRDNYPVEHFLVGGLVETRVYGSQIMEALNNLNKRLDTIEAKLSD